jgi:hypothetical protein
VSVLPWGCQLLVSRWGWQLETVLAEGMVHSTVGQMGHSMGEVLARSDHQEKQG